MRKPPPTMRPARNEASATGRLDVAAVLLVMQGAVGLLSVLGTLVIGLTGGSLPNLSRAILLGLLGPMAALTLAGGIGRLRRWARNGTVAFEVVVLLGGLLRLAVGRGMAVQLVPLLVVAVLPAAILELVLSRPSRRAFARTRRSAPIGVLGPDGLDRNGTELAA